MSENVSELLPCPFCGGKVDIEETGDGFGASCYKCEIGFTESNWKKEYLIQAWNRRADTAPASDAETVRAQYAELEAVARQDLAEGCVDCGPPCEGCAYEKLKAALSRLSAAKGETWISVKDRLPENGQVVAFVIDPGVDYYGGSVCAGHFRMEDYGDEKKYPTFSTWGLGTSASHWMPLPPPPITPSGKE